MSHKFISQCSGKCDVRADLKIKGLQEALQHIKDNHRRISIDDVHLNISNENATYNGFYTVEYTFYFTAFAETNLDIEKLIKKGETLEILSVN